MGKTERREKERAEMRQLILDAALRLFVDKGVENVSLRRIAEKIEYSPATIYLYFRNKDDILFALHSRGFNKLYEYQQSILSIEDPRERLAVHGRVYVEFALNNRELYDLMFIMRAPVKSVRDDQRWESGLRCYNLLRENVRQCIEAGYLPAAEPDTAALAFWSLTHGVSSLVIRGRCSMFPQEHLSDIVNGAMSFVMESMRRGT